MNILAVGYYDDFARFFLRLKKEVHKLDKNIRFHYFSIYFSGFFYALSHRVISKWFPFLIWCKFFTKRKFYYRLASEIEVYKGVDLFWLSEYHVKLDPKNKKYYMAIGCAYLDYVNNFIIQNKISLILSSGDSRMPVRAIIGIARQRDIIVRYFEQGAFGTTFFEHDGVNGNSAFMKIHSDFVNHESETINKQLNAFITRKRAAQFRRFPLYRGFDFIIGFLINWQSIGREIVENKSIKVNKSTDYKGQGLTGSKFVVFAAQVPVDVNMVLHSPNFSNHTEILSYLNSCIPFEYNIIVREHPLFYGQYESSFYETITANSRFILDNSTSLSDVIAKSELVVVNNSTVGIEALCYGKRVLLTGDAYYENVPGVWKVESDTHRLSKPDEYTLMGEELAAAQYYLKVLLCDYLYPGHYRDENLDFVAEIAGDIILGEVRSEKVFLGC